MNDLAPPVPVVDPKRPPTAVLWTGRVLSVLVTLLFLMSAVGKFFVSPQMEEGVEKLGIPMDIMVPLGILEATIALIYFVPQTAVLGAILLTGYMGGTIITHWRVGDNFVFNIIIGVVVWLGIFLRDRRLWDLLPWRRV
ncbi:DoxX family protein [Bremerella cremea]|uniref:DoxX family protein n=1 Tax=Blastopirellula marina TaxID=124 RepID=A0A2S8G617_9BACT|nr:MULTISPECIES: DoxX family protein [Pirellulaceae]PQO39853.1 DoxX family protein [Blastopirellula marina]RCS51319.1 DoxX family protein [Bremerella cremea]